MLSARSAEAGEGIGRHIVPARHTDLADRIRHVVDRDIEEAFRDFLQRSGVWKRVGDFLQTVVGCMRIKRLIAVRTKDVREECRVNSAKKQVAVSHCQRAALAIAGGARIRARAFRADREPPAVELADRSAPCGNGVDLHHRGGHAHAGHHAIAGQLVFAGIMRDIGAGPAHVEADELVMAQWLARSDHADDATRRTGQNGILPAKCADFCQPAVRLHETQAVGFGQTGLKSIGIASQDRREIGIDDGRVAARDQANERRNLVTDADLRKAHVARDGGQPFLVIAIFPAVHQHDGERIDAVGTQPFESPTRLLLVKGSQYLAIGGNPLVDLHHLRGQLFRQDDMPREDIRPGLVADTQRIPEAAGDGERKPFALAFEQRIRRDRCPDPQFRDGAIPMPLHEAPHGFARRIRIMAGIFREQLVGHQRPIGRYGNDIGKGAPAIDSEVPCPLFAARCHCAVPPSVRDRPSETQTMSSGRTRRSNVSASTSSSSSAASLRVWPFLCACFAIVAALS